MDEATALHTAARRYCETEFACPPEDAGTVREYGKIRWREAALIEIEKLIPAQPQLIEDLRPLLLRAGELAQEKVARLADAEMKKAVADQADHYRAYIIDLTRSDLATIEPLPQRRTLDEDESRKLWAAFWRRWNLEIDRDLNLLWFHNDLFDARDGAQVLRDALIGRGISNVLQFHEAGPGLEIDVSIFDPRDGVYSTSHEFGWLVYSHHESAIGISGEWLEETFRQRWPDWRDKIYEGPYLTADLRGTWKPPDRGC
jgi:hypothetical protein